MNLNPILKTIHLKEEDLDSLLLLSITPLSLTPNLYSI